MANKKFKIQDGEEPTGSGFITWKRLQQRFRDIGELQDEDVLYAVEITKDGINYTTKKKKESK